MGFKTWSLTARKEPRGRVLENRLLKRIFGTKNGEVTGEWRKLHSEELNDLYSSPNNVRVIKSRRMTWAEHVTLMGERSTQDLVGKPKGSDHLEDPGRDGRIMLRWIFRKWGHGLDSAGSGNGQVTGTCECGNEPSDSITCGEFLD